MTESQQQDFIEKTTKEVIDQFKDEPELAALYVFKKAMKETNGNQSLSEELVFWTGLHAANEMDED